jgi:hypothetical protein
MTIFDRFFYLINFLEALFMSSILVSDGARAGGIPYHRSVLVSFLPQPSNE